MEGESFPENNSAGCPSIAATGGEASCEASVTSSASVSSTSSPSPRVTAISSAALGLGAESLLSPAVTDDSSIVSGEPPSPPSAPLAAPCGGDSQTPGSDSVRRINPFEQVEVSPTMESKDDVTISGTHVVANGLLDLPLSTSASESVSSQATQDHFPSTPTQLSGSIRSLRGIVSANQGYDDDASTEPSSAVNSADPAEPDSVDSREEIAGANPDGRGSISRFIDNARRRIGSTRKDEALDDKEIDNMSDVDEDLLGENTLSSGSLICGYLQKLGRNGKWQSRWFETDGEFLSYYKNEKRTKLLATLDLEKVGAITVDTEDKEGCSFTIQVLRRLYHLRAETKASCKDWVISLNRIKEARMQQGNVKLVTTSYRHPVDLLDSGMPSENHDVVAPRVVVMTMRRRTRAVEEEQDLNKLIRLEETVGVKPCDDRRRGGSTRKPEKRLSTIGTVVLARWTKRRSSLSRLRSKIAQWARSIRNLGCASEASVGLDSHVHPPGHDDKDSGKVLTDTPKSTKKNDLSEWIGKETSKSSRSPEPAGPLSLDAETSGLRPRKMSSASDADVRVLS